MTRQRFVQEHYDLLNNYWFAIEKSILDWKSKHNWQNVALEDAVAIRNSLEEMINKDLKVSYVDDEHIKIADKKHYCTGPRIHVRRTSNIHGFQLLPEFINDPKTNYFLLVGLVGKERSQFQLSKI